MCDDHTTMQYEEKKRFLCSAEDNERGCPDQDQTLVYAVNSSGASWVEPGAAYRDGKGPCVLFNIQNGNNVMLFYFLFSRFNEAMETTF